MPVAAPGYVPISVRSAVPNAIALWATILTGSYALLTLISAALTPAAVDEAKILLADPENQDAVGTQDPVSLLTWPILIASYVLLALWMSRIRTARMARGEAIGGPPAVEWWGWFVPLANMVLPVLGMRAITKGRAGVGLLVGWWAGVVAYLGAIVVTIFVVFSSIDFATAEFSNLENLDSLVGIQWASAVALTVAWVFLAMIIRVTTRREAEAS